MIYLPFFQLNWGNLEMGSAWFTTSLMWVLLVFSVGSDRRTELEG